MDEIANPEPDSVESHLHRKTMWKLSLLTREHAEFVVALPLDGGEPEALGTQNVNAMSEWTRHAAEIVRRLGEREVELRQTSQRSRTLRPRARSGSR